MKVQGWADLERVLKALRQEVAARSVLLDPYWPPAGATLQIQSDTVQLGGTWTPIVGADPDRITISFACLATADEASFTTNPVSNQVIGIGHIDGLTASVLTFSPFQWGSLPQVAWYGLSAGPGKIITVTTVTWPNRRK